MSDSINRYTPQPRLESLQANLGSQDEFEKVTTWAAGSGRSAAVPSIATGLATLKEEDSKGGVMPFGGIVPSEGGPVRNRNVELLSPERRPAESHRASSLNPYMYGDGTLSTTSSHSTGAQEWPRPTPEGKHASSMLYGAPHKSDPIDDPKELEPIVGPASDTAATPASREKTLASDLWRKSLFRNKESFQSGNIPRDIFSLDAAKLARELHAIAGDEMPTAAAEMWKICKEAAESNSPDPKWLGRFYRGWVNSLTKEKETLTEPDLRRILTPLSAKYCKNIAPFICGQPDTETDKKRTIRIAIEDAFHFSLQAIAKRVDRSGRDLAIRFIPMHDLPWARVSGDTGLAFTRAADRAIAERQQAAHTSNPRPDPGAPSSSADLPPPLTEADFRIGPPRIEPIIQTRSPSPDGLTPADFQPES